MSLFEKVKEILSSLVETGVFQKEDYELCEEYSLSRLTTFATGGKALVLFPEKIEVIKYLFPILVEKKVPYYILGNGSNVIAPDEGYNGLILSTLHMKKVFVKENTIEAQCGASLTAVASLAQKNSLSGMECLYGIPGTIGGAVFMNAGAYGGECKDVLSSVTFLTKEGEVKTLPVNELKMGYRTSHFENSGDFILSALFSLESGEKEEIRSKMDDFMGRRMEKQPLDYPSAGSTFKRCEGRFTAQMIDEAGLKGARVGGAMVSEKHAGFVINYDNATSSDILNLIDHVKKVIFEKEGLHIQCEVRMIG
ncbi:MAG: UDP-N-acetylmuramate dehydrogenase [Clostridia bacterium]|nr:UDP-N-acetylmuramate dehydrogenase [Clostridia bacterium]